MSDPYQAKAKVLIVQRAIHTVVNLKGTANHHSGKSKIDGIARMAGRSSPFTSSFAREMVSVGWVKCMLITKCKVTPTKAPSTVLPLNSAKTACQMEAASEVHYGLRYCAGGSCACLPVAQIIVA